MLDIGWSELLVIGIVALLVVGPKELPALARTIGRYMGVLRKQANEFRAQFDQALREVEVEDVRRDLSELKSDAERATRDMADAGRVSTPGPATPLKAPHKPNFTEDELDWLEPNDRPKAAVAAAAAAAAARKTVEPTLASPTVCENLSTTDDAGCDHANENVRVNGAAAHDAQAQTAEQPIKAGDGPRDTDDDLMPTRREVAVP